MSMAAELAQWAVTLRYEDLPASVVADCRLRLLDTLGVAIAATPLPTGRAVRRAATTLGHGDDATLIGTGERTTAALAALVNGTLAHALDFDDTHNASVMHPSAPCVPACLAAGEAAHASGRDLIVAIAIGNEIGCRLGLVTPGAFHAAGLHPTSILGTPAAVAAIGRLWQMPAASVTSALGISGSQGAGILEAYSDGTWSKTLHPGWAAHAAIVACRLGQAGFTGPATGLDGRYGLFKAFLPAETNFDFARAVAGLGTQWDMLETAFKLYPCAHAIHAFIEAALALRDKHAIGPAQIRAIIFDVPQEFVGQIAEPRAAKMAPRTPTHARASLYYAVAAALADGHVSMTHYEDGSIHRDDLLALTGLMTHRVDAPQSGPIHFCGTVTITLGDGRRVSHTIDEADGTGGRLLSEQRVIEKFIATAGTVAGVAQLRRLVDLVGTIDTQPRIADLLAATAVVRPC